ncbi:MAG: hypothetical protein QW115_00915 [Thermoplasmata archaeon]
MDKWSVCLVVLLLFPLVPVNNPHSYALPLKKTGACESRAYIEHPGNTSQPIFSVPKNLTDPELLGVECGKLRVFIATENLKGLAKDLLSIGINVSFGRTTTYSKLILPVIEVESWKVPQLMALSNALFVGKYPESKVVEPEKGRPAALPNISTDRTGNNTTTLILTDGIEFGIPALSNTFAVWGDGTEYAGYPEVFDFASIYDYLEDGVLSETSWFADTSYNATAYVSNGSVYIDFQNTTYNVTGIPSLSSTFHVGFTPNMPGRGRSAVIVTDQNELWNYDTVYVDLDNDLSFVDEQPVNRSKPIRVKDLNGDGQADISTGLLYWISDGVHPLPHSKFVAERFGFENVVPEAGTILCFFGDYSNGTGTQVAQALVQTAKNTRILPVVVRNETNIFEAWTFCAFGGDYLPKSGDEKDVCLANFLLRVNTNYWNYIDRYFTFLLSQSRVLFVLPALENPYTFSPLSIYGIYAGTYSSNGNRVISTDAWQHTTVILGSKMQLLPSYSQSMYSWGYLFESYGGTALSAAIAAGVLTKLVEILKEQGLQVNPEITRCILMSATENTPLDAWSQGNGILNETEAISLMNLTSNSVRITPANIDFGNYQGTKYSSFCSLVSPGKNYTENITLLSQNSDRDVTLYPVILRRESIVELELVLPQNSTGFLSLNSALNRNATVLRVSIIGTNGSIVSGNFEVEFYVWVDENENSLEDPGEIHLAYSARMGEGMVAFSSAILNWSKISGAFLSFIPISENPLLTFHVRVEWFEHARFDWMPELSIFLPSNFALPVSIELSVPENATLGTYEGKILLESGELKKCIPYRINVAASMNTLHETGECEFYTSSVLMPGNGAPLSRFYYIDVPQEMQGLWNYLVIETNLSDNASVEPYFSYPDTFSILFRKIFGPGSLISFAAAGEHGFGQGGGKQTLMLPLVPGLNALRLLSRANPHFPEILSLRIYGLVVAGEQATEGTVWEDRFEFRGMSTAELSLSCSAFGLQRAEEFCLNMDENHTADVSIVVNEASPFILSSTPPALLSLFVENGEKRELIGYSVDGRIYSPEIQPGNYFIKVFSELEKVNLSWVLVQGSDVRAEIYPNGEIPPETEFFFVAYLPTPSKPGNYSGVISLFLQENAPPCYIPFSQHIIDLPPYFTELLPQNGSVLREAKIQGKYQDSEGTLKTNVSQVSVYLNGANLTPFCIWNETEFSVPIVLSEGIYNVVVVIGDANGMTASAQTSFRVDRTAPPLFIRYPENYMITREQLLFVVCESDADAMVYVNGIPAETDGPGIFFCGINLMEGWNEIEVKAVDAAGNLAVEKRLVCLDSSPPPLTIIFPQTGYITRSPYITVTGYSEYGARVTVNGVTAEPDLTGKFSVGLTLASEGENILEVVARDRAGNENSISFVAVLDRTPPEILLDPVEPLTSSRILTVSGMVRDTYLEPYVIVNSMRVQVIGQRFSVSVLLSEGPNTIKIVAMDMAGNTNTKFLSVILDTTPPSLNLSIPGTVTRPQITLNGTTEPGAKLYINNVSVYVDPKGNFSHVLNLTKGVNFITVSASDAAGNTKVLTFALLYVDLNELNVDDINRYNSLEKKLTELQDSLIYAVVFFCLLLATSLIGLSRYMHWKYRKKEKEENLKSVFEEFSQ